MYLQLSADHPHSTACAAEIAANPLPDLVRPVTYDPARDGQAIPHAILIPDEPLPYPIAWQNQAWYFSDAPGVYPENDYTNARRSGAEYCILCIKCVRERRSLAPDRDGSVDAG